MELLTTSISIVLIVGLVITPILLFVGLKEWYGLRFEFLAYLILAIVLTAGITSSLAWWSDFSGQLLMGHYGYNFDGTNGIERFDSVADVDLERVKELETASYGIGWPLRAIMLFVFYSPYLFIVYWIGQIARRMRSKVGTPIEIKP